MAPHQVLSRCNILRYIAPAAVDFVLLLSWLILISAYCCKKLVFTRLHSELTSSCILICLSDFIGAFSLIPQGSGCCLFHHLTLTMCAFVGEHYAKLFSVWCFEWKRHTWFHLKGPSGIELMRHCGCLIQHRHIVAVSTNILTAIPFFSIWVSILQQTDQVDLLAQLSELTASICWMWTTLNSN